MKTFYIETALGCGIRLGTNEKSVRLSVLREVGGENGPIVVRIATQENIDWVKMMGGYIPKGAAAEE